MTLAARGIALQGFLLSPVAMAVQGLLGGDPADPTPPEAAQVRAAIVGRGPGTTVNWSEYFRQLAPPVAPVLPPQRPNKKRQRMEEDTLRLAEALEL